MAYITKEKTATIREQLKKAFPASEGWKLSLTNERHSVLHLSILRAPIRFADKDYQQMHNYDSYQNSEVLKYMDSVINGRFLPDGEKNFNDSDIMTDYHHVGWYAYIQQGQWDKPFQLSTK